jgi:hypothetical protein
LKGVIMGIWHPAQDDICICSPFCFNYAVIVSLNKILF